MHAAVTRAAWLAAAFALAATPALAQDTLTEVESPGAATHQEAGFRTDTIDIALKPGGDPHRGHMVEYMVRMKAGDVLVYSWDAPQAEDIYHDFHGHTDETVTFYKQAEGATHHGSLIAPFDGVHGWYLENRTDGPVAVRIKISGFYELIEPGDEGNEWGIEANQPPAL